MSTLNLLKEEQESEKYSEDFEQKSENHKNKLKLRSSMTISANNKLLNVNYQSRQNSINTNIEEIYLSSMGKSHFII